MIRSDQSHAFDEIPQPLYPRQFLPWQQIDDDELHFLDDESRRVFKTCAQMTCLFCKRGFNHESFIKHSSGCHSFQSKISFGHRDNTYPSVAEALSIRGRADLRAFVPYHAPRDPPPSSRLLERGSNSARARLGDKTRNRGPGIHTGPGIAQQQELVHHPSPPRFHQTAPRQTQQETQRQANGQKTMLATSHNSTVIAGTIPIQPLSGPPTLGVSLSIDAFVKQVHPGGAAAGLGVSPGDQLKSLARISVATRSQVPEILAAARMSGQVQCPVEFKRAVRSAGHDQAQPSIRHVKENIRQFTGSNSDSSLSAKSCEVAREGFDQIQAILEDIESRLQSVSTRKNQ